MLTLRQLVHLFAIPLQLLTAFAALRVTLHFLEAKPGRRYLILLYVVHYLTMNAIVYVGDPVPPLLMIPIFIGALCLCCRGPLPARLSMGLLLVLLPLSFSGLLTNIRPPFDRYYHFYTAALWGGLLLFVHRALPHHTKPPLRSARLWALVDLLALMPFGSEVAVIALTQMLYRDSAADPFQGAIYIQNERVLLVVLALAAVEVLGLLVAVVVLARHEQLEEEQLLWQINSRHYGHLEETQKQIRHLRHDMANHLTAMTGLDDTAMRRYLDELIASPALHTGRRYCEHDVVNAVLGGKLPPDEEGEGDTYIIDVRIPKEMPLSDIDLCALFSNALDNALEAGQKLAPAERLLQLTAKVENGFFLLELLNNTGGEPHTENGVLKTTKPDRTAHGFGVQSMQSVAKRLGGSCEARRQGNQFKLLVVIPVHHNP